MARDGPVMGAGLSSSDLLYLGYAEQPRRGDRMLAAAPGSLLELGTSPARVIAAQNCTLLLKIGDNSQSPCSFAGPVLVC